MKVVQVRLGKNRKTIVLKVISEIEESYCQVETMKMFSQSRNSTNKIPSWKLELKVSLQAKRDS
jgi:hypothetical protein